MNEPQVMVRRREGFVAASAPQPQPQPAQQDLGYVPPQPPVGERATATAAPQQMRPQESAPQAPLPSQLTNEPPALEAPLTEIDRIRRDISQSQEDWPIKVELLYKPIMNERNETVQTLTFREPTAADINRVGNPTRMLWDNEVIVEERKMTHMMSQLCGIPVPWVERMDPRDWNAIALRLRKFFLPDLRGIIW